MAFYRCGVRNISRGADGTGKSSVAAAAYRAGENLYDKRKGVTHCYEGRQTDVLMAEIYQPANAPDWASDRQMFWNNLESSERYKNARTAKEIILSFPYQMDMENIQTAVSEFVQDSIITPHEVAVDVSIHRYGRKYQADSEDVKKWQNRELPFLTGGEADNADFEHVKIVTDKWGAISGYKHYAPHAHVMMPLRAFDENTETGFVKKKNREMDKPRQIWQWRQAWEDSLNNQFIALDSHLRVSCKNLQAANDDTIPEQWKKEEVDGFELDVYAIATEAKEESEPLLVDLNFEPDPSPQFVSIDLPNDNDNEEEDNEGNSIEPDKPYQYNLLLPDFADDDRLQNYKIRHNLKQSMAYKNELSQIEKQTADDLDRMFQAWAKLRNRQEELTRRSKISTETQLPEMRGIIPGKDNHEWEAGR